MKSTFTAGSIPRRGTNELEWGLLLSDVGTQETAVQASCVSMLDRPVVSQKKLYEQNSLKLPSSRNFWAKHNFIDFFFSCQQSFWPRDLGEWQETRLERMAIWSLLPGSGWQARHLALKLRYHGQLLCRTTSLDGRFGKENKRQWNYCLNLARSRPRYDMKINFQII